MASGPNSYWAKAGLDYKRWLEGSERREQVLREALEKISVTYDDNLGMGARGARLRGLARSALAEFDGD